MTALAGFHHVSVLTTDVDRLVAFYRNVFGAAVVLESAGDGDARSSFVDMGGGGFLHAHEGTGGLDHVALHAPTQEVFLECRRRVLAAGAGDGRVRDFGAAWELKFHDPDGTEGDLIWPAADFPRGAVRRYADAPILPWSEPG